MSFVTLTVYKLDNLRNQLMNNRLLVSTLYSACQLSVPCRPANATSSANGRVNSVEVRSAYSQSFVNANWKDRGQKWTVRLSGTTNFEYKVSASDSGFITFRIRDVNWKPFFEPDSYLRVSTKTNLVPKRLRWRESGNFCSNTNVVPVVYKKKRLAKSNLDPRISFPLLAVRTKKDAFRAPWLVGSEEGHYPGEPKYLCSRICYSSASSAQCPSLALVGLLLVATFFK